MVRVGKRLAPWADAAEGASLFNRLRLLLAMVFLLGSTLAVAVGWAFSNAAADEAYDQLLTSAAMQIAETLDTNGQGVTVSPPEAAFETLALSQDDRIFYSVWGPDGRMLTGYHELTPTPLRHDDQPLRTANVALRGVPIRSITLWRPISGDGIRGWTAVVVGQTRGARHRLAWSLVLKISAIVILTGGLGYVTSLVAARRALAPLARIETALARRAPHDVSPLAVRSPAETQTLVAAINAVMGRLDARMSKLQQFAAVAAHQIRTPLAAMTAQLELLEAAGSPQDRAARATRIRGRVNELARLTNQLLGHAMIVYRRDLNACQRIDLTPLVRLAGDSAIPQSLDRDLVVGFDAPTEPVWVRADPVGLREALINVIHNAVTHGARSRLEITVRVADGWACATVFDDGSGIGEDQWDKVIVPFGAPRMEGPGAGLGLSIVQEVVTAQGGALFFEHHDDGFAVSLRLPLATELSE